MPDMTQLPHLIKLLDDDTPSIQKVIIKELSDFGPTLQDKLKQLALPMDDQQKKILQKVYNLQSQQWLSHTWHEWILKGTETEKLEQALSLIADFQYGEYHTGLITNLLDELAGKFIQKKLDINPFALNHFLFKEEGLRGAQTDYFNPLNSNLAYAIQNKRGIPITLCCIYMLVGHRLELDIHGCNYPGHFLARIKKGRKIYLIDCFHQGKTIDAKEIIKMHQTQSQASISSVIKTSANAQTIISRVLRNLMRAYHEAHDKENSQLMIELLQKTDSSQSERVFPGQLFKPGELVQHHRYGYRAVVVDTDSECRADEFWFQSNQTQPPKNQPWYHLLVDGSSQSTYSAQSNLGLDESQDKINHPLIPYFFSEFMNGKYTRNDQPWPGNP